MKKHWIIETLNDLGEFASSNDLTQTKLALDRAIEVALEEIMKNELVEAENRFSWPEQRVIPPESKGLQK